MPTAHELVNSLFEGIREGRKDTLGDRPYFRETLGINPDYDTLHQMPVEVGPLHPRILGVTHVENGKAVGMRINSNIINIGLYLAEKYRKSMDWAKDVIRYMARNTTHHEDYHVLSAPLARGETITDDARDIMESVTTRGRYKVAKRRGLEKIAEMIKDTNPYPTAWKMAEIADWAPYEGPSGKGYRGFLQDASQEKFYKPLGRLAMASAKAGWRKAKEYVSGRMPAYAMA